MIKSYLKTGTPMVIIKVEHYVKLVDFAKHLTEEFYKKGESFDKNITRTKAMEILKRGLFFHGLRGEYDLQDYESSTEFYEIWNPIYEDAYEWVKTKYPHLITEEDD